MIHSNSSNAFSAKHSNQLPDCEARKQQCNDSDNDDDDELRQRKSGYFNLPCCPCPCSTPLLLGLLAGALTMGLVFAVLLSLYIVTPGKTASTVTQTTGTSTTTTSATTTTTTTATSTSTSSTSSSTSSTSTSSTTSSSSTSSSTTSTSSSTSTSATTTTATTATTVTTKSTTSATTTTTTSTTTTKPWCTTKVTFDNITGQTSTSGVVPNGYQNLNWTNTNYLNASTVPSSGYPIAMQSPSYVAYNPGGAAVQIISANGTSFSFDSVTIAAAYRSGLQWNINLYRLGVLQISGPFLINTVNSTIISCGGCTNIDTIVFTTSGGTAVNGLSGSGTEFGFDDLCISFGY
ncbi:unnamed protein product [Adineta ricciae]|uniref:Uncharacterized protein n=1 Tax=Adineta ricciae TaxID=249248 RepID=A0A813NSZ6_ADIRI|nr:unnamed protein product [Adineta ricciae]CAF0744082.1 unnamed protein product [Adineta ricciae]